MDGGVR
jgi:hypothetical protein